MTTRRRSIGSQQAILVICVLAVLSGCQMGGRNANSTVKELAVRGTGVHTYKTTFPIAENPLSEGGNWIEGHAAGASLWGNVQTTSGFAYGVDEPTKYGDPTAILAGAWGAEQTVTATVKIYKTPTHGCCHEVELRLRTTISSNSITGYEAYCSVMPDMQYCHIARWNGPNGSYWNFEKNSIAMYLVDGDVIKATVTGINPVIITLYRNNVPIEQAFDTGAAGGGFGAYGPWTSGNPGIGFFNNHEINWKDFGLSSFSVTDDESATAPPAGGR